MEDWKETKLGDEIGVLTDYTANGSFESLKQNVQYYNDINHAALVRTTDLGKSIFRPERFTDRKGYAFLKTVHLYGGEIVIANVGSLGKAYRVPNYPMFMVLAPNMYLLKFKETVDEDYIFQYLISSNFKDSLLKVIGSTTLQAVNKDNLRSIRLKLPKDKFVQTRIAEILNTADEAIAHTEALIAKYQRIKTGLMQDLLTNGIDENGTIRSKETHKFVVKNGIEVPEEWEVLSLGDLFVIKSGATPLREKHEQYFYQGENCWVKTLDLNDGYIYNTEENITNKAVKECNCKIRPINTILIAMYGGWNQIGRTGILKTVASTNQAISALINPKREIDFDYILFYLQYFKHRWKVFASSTRKDPNITKEDVEKFIITIPHKFDEQNRITNQIKQITNLIDIQYTELSKLQSLKTGLMQDLLSGKVRVKIDKELETILKT